MHHYLPFKNKRLIVTVLLLFSLACTATIAHAQFTLTGKVISSEDQGPVPGVNILIKGTSNGTITDVNGAYTINLETSNEILIFSFVGFATQEVSVNGRTQVDVTLVAEYI